MALPHFIYRFRLATAESDVRFVMFRSSFFLVCSLLASIATADELDVLPDELTDGPKTQMLHRALMAQSTAALDLRSQAYELIKTEDDALAYQRKMKEFFVERLGGFPERTPLNAYRVARYERDGYVVEKIVFESRPNFHVTALLFLPRGQGPFPGILVPCGHSAEGKAAIAYQRVSALLARHGMAALCYDPLGQGERHQVLLESGQTSSPHHNILGVSCIPLGTNFAQFRIWDGMRALDYLASRPEVDPTRLGCTGNSGGGTLTCYLMALDDRIACAAPSCYVTSMRSLLQFNGPQDAEQNIFGQVSFGLTHAEYTMMRAPRPTLLCTATQDVFGIGGAWDSFRENKRFYARFGYPERMDLVETDEGHGFHVQLREGATRWMQRWLLGIDEPIVEGDFEVLTAAEALCIDQGQVLHLANERTLFDVNAETENSLAQQRHKLWAEKEPMELLSRVRQLANIQSMSNLKEAQVTTLGDPIQREGFEIRKLTISRDSGVLLPALAFVPKNPNGNTTLYIDGAGKRQAAMDDGELEELVNGGTLVIAVDLCGLGELRDPKFIAAKQLPHRGEWQQYFHAYLLERSLVGLWAEDVLQTARWLSTCELNNCETTGKSQPVQLIGVGLAGPAVLHAAALEPSFFSSVELRSSLDSWSTVVRDRQGCGMQLFNTVHAALTVYDLPDLRRVVGPHKLRIVDPRGSQDEPLTAGL